MEDRIEFFRQHGYCVLPQVLSGEELQLLNQAIDADRRQYLPLWMSRGEGGRFQSVSVLLTQPVFDCTLYHPAVLPLVRELMGEELCFEEHSVMVREALAGEVPTATWHRDTAHLPSHPLALRNLSAVYYLTDVDEHSHCFAVVPEDAEAKRKLPTDRDAARGRELYGAAGTAILFNAGSCHAGVVKPSSRDRRTVHVYYGHRSQPFLSNFNIVPRRLSDHHDPGLRSLFNRPNLNTALIQENFP
jgi:ectoine hydroxylase-related dioxygenase (phytanoyl-CoA dioxygenase family)